MKRALGVIVTCSAICFPNLATALAQGGATKITVFDNIKAAGWVGVLIILLSIAGLSLIITFAMHLRRRKRSPSDTGEGLSQ